VAPTHECDRARLDRAGARAQGGKQDGLAGSPQGIPKGPSTGQGHRVPFRWRSPPGSTRQAHRCRVPRGARG